MKVIVLLFLISSQLGISQIIKDTTRLKTVAINNSRTITSKNQTHIDSTIQSNYISNSLDDVLAETTPVFVKSLGRGALSTVSFRGTSASHTDVVWNGMSIKSPMLGQVDFSQVPVYFLDDITLLNGGSSIEESNGALGGTISIKNKIDWNNKISGRLLSGYGSYKTFNNFGQLNIGNNKIQSKTRFFNTTSKNDFTYTNKSIGEVNANGEISNPTSKNNNADYHQLGILQELYLRVSNKIDLSVNYWYQNNKRSLPRLNTFEGSERSNINSQVETTHRGIVKATYFNTKSTTEISSGIVYAKSNYTLENEISGFGLSKAIDSRSQYSSSYNQIKHTINTNKKNKLSFSYNFNFHKVSSEESVNNTGYNATRLEHLFYTGWNKKWSNRFKTELMVRSNIIDNKFVPIIPYLGFSYQLLKTKSLFLKSSISRNYNVPTLNDLYWQPGGNPNLKNEKSQNIDLGIQHSIKTKKFSLSNEVSTYYSEVENWIMWLPSIQGFWQPENVKRVALKGIEYHLKSSFEFKKVKFDINLNYAYTSSVNKGSTQKWGENSIGKQLPYIPLNSFNFFLRGYYKGFFITYTNNSYSQRFTTPSNEINRRDWLYPYYMNNISVGKNISLKNTELTLELKTYNLFNEEYRSVLGRPMPGRNYLLTLMFIF